jgi:hypothetical protein
MRPCLGQRVGVLGQRPVSSVWCGCPAARVPVQAAAVRCPVRASERPDVQRPVSGVGVWLGPAQGTAGRDRSRAITSIPDRWKGQDQPDGGGRGARLGQSVTSVRKLSRPLPHVRIEPRRPGAQESLLPKADTGNSLGCSEFSGTETETRDKEVGLEAHPVYRHRGPARPGAQLRHDRLPQEQREQGRRRVPASPNEHRADCHRLIAKRQAAGESSGLAKDQRRRARRHVARDHRSAETTQSDYGEHLGRSA